MTQAMATEAGWALRAGDRRRSLFCAATGTADPGVDAAGAQPASAAPARPAPIASSGARRLAASAPASRGARRPSSTRRSPRSRSPRRCSRRSSASCAGSCPRAGSVTARLEDGAAEWTLLSTTRPARRVARPRRLPAARGRGSRAPLSLRRRGARDPPVRAARPRAAPGRSAVRARRRADGASAAPGVTPGSAAAPRGAARGAARAGDRTAVSRPGGERPAARRSAQLSSAALDARLRRRAARRAASWSRRSTAKDCPADGSRARRARAASCSRSSPGGRPAAPPFPAAPAGRAGATCRAARRPTSSSRPSTTPVADLVEAGGAGAYLLDAEGAVRIDPASLAFEVAVSGLHLAAGRAVSPLGRVRLCGDVAEPARGDPGARRATSPSSPATACSARRRCW